MSVGATTAESVEAGAESPVLAPELVEAMSQRVSSRFRRALVRGGIVAGGVVVEANGAEVIAEGFGFEDYGERVPVDLTGSRFYIGSNSKTFTGIALARLIEEGKIASIDDPLDRYISDELYPELKSAGVTLRDLVTHSAGIESSVFAVRQSHLGSFREMVDRYARFLPARDPDRKGWSIYSNFGAVLIGRVIERASGTPYRSYVEDKVLAPLGLENTAFDDGQTGRVVRNQGIVGGRAGVTSLEPVSESFLPSLGLTSSLRDMARLMRALTGHLDLSHDPILAAAIARAREPIGSNDAALNGIGYYVYESQWNDKRLLHHVGSYNSSISYYTTTTDGSLSICTAASSNGFGVDPRLTVQLAQDLVQDVLGPHDHRPVAGPATFSTEELDGIYRSLRRNYTSIEPLLELNTERFTIYPVNRLDDDRLGIFGLEYHRIGGNVFAVPGYTATRTAVAFSEGPDGVPYIVWGSDVAEKVGLLDNPYLMRMTMKSFPFGIVVASLLLALSLNDRGRVGVALIGVLVLSCIAMWVNYHSIFADPSLDGSLYRSLERVDFSRLARAQSAFVALVAGAGIVAGGAACSVVRAGSRRILRCIALVVWFGVVCAYAGILIRYGVLRHMGDLI